MTHINRFKNIVALLLVVLFMFSAVPVVCAAEYEETDPYYIHHNVTGNGYTGPKFQYFSPYITNYTFDDASSFIQSYIYTLYNTRSGEVIPAYCMDIEVGAYAGHKYRPLNLEDSGYSAGVSGFLRAIILKGFYITEDPTESTEAHTARVNARLKEIGEAAGVEDLTIGEAISGTQAAIWKTVHGSHLEFTDFVRSIYTGKFPSQTKYYDLCNEERINGHIKTGSYGAIDSECDAFINSRIKAVYDYLLSLEPVEADKRVASAASFTKLNDPVLSRNSDGTYDVTVETTVDVDMSAGDSLTLSAVVDSSHYASTSLSDGSQTVTLTIRSVPADIAFNNVTLNIDGTQSIYEVLMFDAEGERGTAQTMIGMDDSQVAVHASVLSTTSRILNFYKTSLVATGTDTYIRQPLEGITFGIYLVANMSDYLSGNVKVPDPEEYELPKLPTCEIITDGDGRGFVNFTHQGLPDGIYLVVEHDHDAIEEPVAPFYVIMPSTNSSGTGYDYEITVQPKNDIKGSVFIEKDVISLGNDEASVDAYSDHTWIIGTNIPEDIGEGKSFEISDTLDNRLDYIGNVKVNVETADGSQVMLTLSQGADYKLTVSDENSLSEGKPSDAFTLRLTRVGMGKIAKAVENGSVDDYMLRVYFDAQINANAEMGEEIPNRATLDYSNSVNYKFHAESDRPVVYTGAVNLLKVESGNHSIVLQGAVFEVYRSATAEEIADNAEELTYLKGVSAPVIKSSFFDNSSLKGDKVSEAASDENGRVAIYGLSYGKYYLVEAKAPTGYNLLGQPAEFTVDSTSHSEERIITVENTTGAILPETGGIGTAVYTVGGIFLMSMGCLFLYMNKRRDDFQTAE